MDFGRRNFIEPLPPLSLKAFGISLSGEMSFRVGLCFVLTYDTGMCRKTFFRIGLLGGLC